MSVHHTDVRQPTRACRVEPEAPQMMESKHAADDDTDGNAVNAVVGALATAPLEVAGERAATTSLNAFLAQVEHRAFRLAEMQLRQREDALDAVQDAMLRLAEHYRD